MNIVSFIDHQGRVGYRLNRQIRNISQFVYLIAMLNF